MGSALGARAARLPDRVQRALSLEGRGAGDRGRSVKGGRGRSPYEEILQVYAKGAAPLEEPVEGMAERTPLHIAVVIPPFDKGSGGHMTIFTLVDRLERAGPHLQHLDARPARDATSVENAAVLRRRVVDEFVPMQAPRVQGVRRLARRGRGGGHRLGYAPTR